MAGHDPPADLVPSPQAAPVARADRIEAIDALRGMALFGVLMINLITEFRVSIFAQFLPGSASETPADKLVNSFLASGLEMTAFSLFSLLFGVGLAIQFERLEPRPDRLFLLIRRLAALLMFGLIHLFLIWNGDILTEYAVAGFLVLPLLFAPSWILGATSALLLVFYAVMPLLNLHVPFPSQDWMIAHVREANASFGRGDYGQVLRFNISEVRPLIPLHVLVIPRTLGLFALGAWLWRTGIFRQSKRLAFVAAGLGGVAAGYALRLATNGQGFGTMATLGAVGKQIGPIVLALGYAGVILTLATGEHTRPFVTWAAPLGRTAFSNYLMQSIIFGWIFYGYGLGLFDRLAPAPTFVLGVVVFAAQAVISTYWLRLFQFGPMEWLWRSLMYGQRQPLVRRSVRLNAKTMPLE